jgi:uncharacterized protein
MKKLFTLALVALTAATLQAEPKKLLVVTTTVGFRHASIPTLEKMLSQLAKDSGEFTVDFVQQPPGKPTAPKKPAPFKTDALESVKEAFNIAEEKYVNEKAAYDVAETAWEAGLKMSLQKLSPENLKHYDGVVFASTTGDLPIPDQQGFLDWIKAGHAFIGLHAASDTFPGWPGYTEMLGGHFQHHGPQVAVECLNQDTAHPATAMLGKSFSVSLEEIYQFKNYDAAKVHDLLIMNQHPEHPEQSGHFAVAWCKEFGAGKVFYTSLGHREDVIDADPNLKDRKNSVAIAKAYQAHVLGGIEWALGIKK